MRAGFWFLPIVIPGLALCARPDVYGKTNEIDYLTGRFSPERHPAFVRLDSLGVPTSRPMHLRREAAVALKSLYAAFRRDHPKVRFRIVSATRNFDAQQRIWEAKWNGHRRVDGRNLRQSVPDGLERGRIILRYSSMPGTSRHHWGTDVDITSLKNSYFEKGEGRILLDWLEAHAGRYGFCRPYTAGRSTGYLEERWHWSYRPLSGRLLAAWLERFGPSPERSLGFARFAGAESVRSLAPIYVRSVSDACR